LNYYIDINQKLRVNTEKNNYDDGLEEFSTQILWVNEGIKLLDIIEKVKFAYIITKKLYIFHDFKYRGNILIKI